MPFARYVLAEEIHASGVIAIVIAAVEMSSRASFTAEDRVSGHSFWVIVELVFTGLALSAVASMVQFVCMWVLYQFKKRMNRTDVAPLYMQEVLLMTWGGMRGLVTLALVLSIPAGTVPYHHELSVIALSVLTFTMVISGLLLPWLVCQLNLEAGPDAGGDRVAAEHNERAYQAARRTVQEHGPKLASESYFMVQEWLDALAERRHVGPEGSRERREAFERACATAIEAQNMALASATAELEQARSERRYNPADVDAVLAELDAMVFAAERDALAPPRRPR